MNAFKSYIARMGRFQRILLAAVIVAIEFFGIYELAYTPKLTALNTEKDKKVKLSSMLGGLEKNPKFKAMNSETAGPIPVTADHVAKLAAQGNRLFDKEARDAFSSELSDLAGESGLKNFAHKEAKDKAGFVLVKLDNGKGGRDTIQVQRIARDLSFKCQYAELYRFIDKLRDKGYYLRVGALKAVSENNTSNLAVTMTLYLYCEEGS